MQIIIIEDDKRISKFILKGLQENGYFVILCETAEEFLNLYLKNPFDLIICDIMLPGIDGLQLVQNIRFKKIYAPILMLTSLSSIHDKTIALDLGADDYMTKPFHFDELLSRVNALIRRQQYSLKDQYKNIFNSGDLIVDLNQYNVKISGQEVILSPKEFKLLSYLIENTDKVVSRTQILNAVWGITFDNHTNVVDVYISYLRNKIEKNYKYIFTIKGVGYILKTT